MTEKELLAQGYRKYKGKDIDVEKIFICPVCGYTIEGELPNYCPVCNTKKELFKTF